MSLVRYDSKEHVATITMDRREKHNALNGALCEDLRQAWLRFRDSDDRVAVLCTRTQDVIGIVAVANTPSCVVEGLDAEFLYIADYSGEVTVAPVASIVALGAEPPALESRPSIEWVMPELGPREPALA